MWTALLTVLLASFAFVTLLTNSKSETIKNNIQALQLENDSYRKIDTCISILYSAENNSRLYVVTLDPAYLHAYKDELKTVTTILNKYETEKKSHAKSLSGLILNKQQKNEEFVNLRMMVDSLLSFSFDNSETKAVAPPKKAKKVNVISQASKTDSVQVSSQKSKRKLVKRIMDAIRDKDTLAKGIALTKSSTVVSRDSLTLPVQSQAIRNADLLEKARRQLSATEQQLLTINARIFANLQHSLQALKNVEERNARELRNNLLLSTTSKFEEMSLLAWGSVALVILLAAMIISNLVKLYKKDATIVRYAQLTAETIKQKGDLMAQMTHEIRTPLNSIIGFSQLIDTQKLDDDLRQNVTAIKSASNILLTLVNEILDFSKFESGKITLKDGPFKPVVLMDEAVSMLSVLANEKNITVSTQFNLDPDVRLQGDDFRIKQIVINLLTNAIKFTPDYGKILVTAQFEKSSADKGLLKINVKDSGVGIAEEHLKAIFEDFIQVESNDSTARQVGTGLGLAICKRIANLYGGHINVKSTVGEGSEFMVRLPLKVAASAPKTVQGATDAHFVPEKILKGKKVLIADDTKMNLILMSKIMDKLGASYDLTSDGQKAFEMFGADQYDLVITDIYMPVLDGVELTKRIRGHEKKEKAKIPVLGFTGNTDDKSLAHYSSIGMNDVLSKPFDEKHFETVLRRILNN
jgi:signal transduction histidine kinase